MSINLYFDGYCPESSLKGNKVEMRLNQDDFWESEATGLQIVISEPYAVLLRWRGKGKFLNSSGVASDALGGQVMIGSSDQDGEELIPDREHLISSAFDLDWYLHMIEPSREEWEKKRFDPHAPILKEQEDYLSGLTKEQWQGLKDAMSTLHFRGEGRLVRDESFDRFHQMLYELKLVFPFDWISWKKGHKQLRDPKFDYTHCSLLERSMYLTSIFRGDKYSDGTIEEFFQNGAIQKIILTIDIDKEQNS